MTHAEHGHSQGEPGATNESAVTTDVEQSRRTFLGSVSTLAMAGGLTVAYGGLGVVSVRYLYPDDSPPVWLFAARVNDMPPGSSLDFVSPAGAKIVISRAQAGAAEAAESEFRALSSTCPHLGCQVHWEAANARFFCPCHNGAFDARGVPTAGPPLAANQPLPQYALRIENELLLIGLPQSLVVAAPDAGLAAESPRAASRVARRCGAADLDSHREAQA